MEQTPSIVSDRLIRLSLRERTSWPMIGVLVVIGSLVLVVNRGEPNDGKVQDGDFTGETGTHDHGNGDAGWNPGPPTADTGRVRTLPSRGHLSLWQADANGNLTLDMSSAQRVLDRVRYFYTWNGNAKAQPKITMVQPAAAQPTGTSLGVTPGLTVTEFEQKYGAIERSIVLLLESPHIDEIDQHLQPKGPAMGATGRRISSNLQNLARLIRALGLKGTQIPVIIANAVPHPTSCRLRAPRGGIVSPHQRATLNKFFQDWRDEVFKGFLPLVRDDLHTRINSYKPDVVFNACTGTNTLTPLVRRELVQSLDKNLRPAVYVRRDRQNEVCSAKRYWVLERSATEEAAVKRQQELKPNGKKWMVEIIHPSSWTKTIREWRIS
jgi:hypothetical protein